jgi:hypothetical protein
VANHDIVTDNTSLANGMDDLFAPAHGLPFPECSANVRSGNKFFTANQTCIH